MKYWLLSTEGMPPKGGGIGSYIQITAQLFSEKGHEVTVFIHNIQEKAIREEISGGIRFVYFPYNIYDCKEVLGYHAHLSWSFAQLLEKYMKAEGVPDILESQEYLGIAYYTFQYKLLLYPYFKQLRVVVTCHAPAFVYLEYNHYVTYELSTFWVGEMEKSVLASADLVITPSRYIVQEIRKQTELENFKPIHVLNPIWQKTVSEKITFTRGKLVCFGKMSRLKGSLQLLTYFKRIWEAGEKWTLEIIGGGHQLHVPENESMERLIKRQYKKYIDNGLLILHGALDHKQAMAAINSAQVVIIPSLIDNLPYTVIESLQTGGVVLASKQGGHAEIIEDGKNGFLFDHHISLNFENRLRHILSLSDEEWHEVSGQAKESVSTIFDTEAIYEKKMDLLTGLMRRGENDIFPFTRAANSLNKEKTPEKQSPLVSVIIPYYNLSEFIEDAVKSALNSGIDDLEILIIDDGSTDLRSEKVLERMSKMGKVKVFHKMNEGLALARNFGAGLAEGKYLAFLDADDMFDGKFLQKSVEVLERYKNVHFVTGWLSYFGNSRGGWAAFNPEPPFFLVHNMVSCAIVVDKNSFSKFGQNDPNLIYGMEDWDMAMSLVANGCKGVVLPEFLIRYRVRKTSMTRGFTDAKRLFSFKYIARKHKRFYAQYADEVAHLLNANGPGIYTYNPSKGAPGHHSVAILGVKIPIGQKLKEFVQSRKTLFKVVYPVYHFFKR